MEDRRVPALALHPTVWNGDRPVMFSHVMPATASKLSAKVAMQPLKLRFYQISIHPPHQLTLHTISKLNTKTAGGVVISTMISRSAFRAQHALRAQRVVVRRGARFESTVSKATPDTGAGSGALTGGLAGGGAALLIVYSWYHFSGAKGAVQTAKQSKAYLDKATNSLKVKFDEKTPDNIDEVIKALRDAANKYAAFIPFASQYVDSAFDDLDAVRRKHGSEVDSVVREAYAELRDASKQEMNMQTAGEVYSILAKHIERLLHLGKDAAEDVLNNHPQLKEKLGGSADQLKQLGDRIGPQAKQEIDQTWKQVNELLQGGLTATTLVKAQSLLREKTQKLQEMGEQAFNQGWDQLKPLLDKNPKVKEAVEGNMDALKQGNISETVSKVKDAVQSGNVQDLQQYIDQ